MDKSLVSRLTLEKERPIDARPIGTTVLSPHDSQLHPVRWLSLPRAAIWGWPYVTWTVLALTVHLDPKGGSPRRPLTPVCRVKTVQARRPTPLPAKIAIDDEITDMVAMVVEGEEALMPPPSW